MNQIDNMCQIRSEVKATPSKYTRGDDVMCKFAIATDHSMADMYAASGRQRLHRPFY